ncbi:MAG: radical SAM protein [Desulfobacterales bacterium]|nr:radical SAM protein [Desulfobacterales bacterium]
MHQYQRLTAVNDQLNDRYVRENEYQNVVTYPKLVTLTTTLKCNYRCWMCYQQEFKGEMDWRIVEGLAQVLPFVKTLQLFGGEPLIYSKLESLCRLAGDSRCELELITNGSLLDERRRALLLDNNARLIKISLEAAKQETYESIRGGNLLMVFDNIKKLTAERDARTNSKLELQINYVAMRRNIEELADVIRMAANAGVIRVLVLYMFTTDREDLARESLFFHQELSDRCMNEALATGLETGVEVIIPGFFSIQRRDVEGGEMDHTCHSPWKNCLIDIAGNVRICCGKTPTLGNLLDTAFDDLWFCDAVTSYRKTVNTEKQLPACRVCRVKGRSINNISFHIRDKALAEQFIARTDK